MIFGSKFILRRRKDGYVSGCALYRTVVVIYIVKTCSNACMHFLGIDGDIRSVNQADECENLATKPIKYVVAFDNGN